MRLLIFGTLNGLLTTATKIAMDNGATVTQAKDHERAMQLLSRGKRADLLLVDVELDIRDIVMRLQAGYVTMDNFRQSQPPWYFSRRTVQANEKTKQANEKTKLSTFAIKHSAKVFNHGRPDLFAPLIEVSIRPQGRPGSFGKKSSPSTPRSIPFFCSRIA